MLPRRVSPLGDYKRLATWLWIELASEAAHEGVLEQVTFFEQPFLFASTGLENSDDSAALLPPVGGVRKHCACLWSERR